MFGSILASIYKKIAYGLKMTILGRSLETHREKKIQRVRKEANLDERLIWWKSIFLFKPLKTTEIV